MWNDIETTQDALNFSVVAETAAELIIESNGQPISIGVSGSWGIGKSSMVKMIGDALRSKSENGKSKEKYIYLEFNAWLYQGYDDARTALLQAVSDKLIEEAEAREGFIDKVKSFAKRINWLQLAKLVVPVSMGFLSGGATLSNFAAIANISTELDGIVKENSTKTMPQQIEELRNEFEELLSEMGVTLVVLVDDLDRCLPATSISTLEAMRLLLFVERTAFIIAADTQMIRSSVRAHFSEISIDDGLVTSYFDKLIQIPLSVPRLGISEVKVYIVTLFADLALRKGDISDEAHAFATTALQTLLRESWRGGISTNKLETAFREEDVPKIRSYIDIAEQLSRILVTANGISGNPRLIKRFLNELMIREKVAKLNGMSIEFNSLVKMLLFERCSTPAALEFLIGKVTESENGILDFLDEIETALTSANEYRKPDDSWESQFIQEWIKLESKLGKMDLRPLLYLSRDKSSAFAAYDELTEVSKEILKALELVDKGIMKEIVNSIKASGESESEKILARICSEGQAKQWDMKILGKALHITEAYPNLGSRLVIFLNGIPPQTRNPAFIPLLRNKDWANDMLIAWANDTKTPAPVKNAIKEKGA